MATLAHHHAFHERRTAERRRIAYPAMLHGGDGMRVSWGGIFGGVLVALGVLLLLTALGVAVGISAAQPGETDAATLGTGAGIWAAASLLAALFIGGMVSTRIGAIFDRTTGAYEGVLVWVVSVLLVAYLAGSGIGMLAGGAFNLVGGASQAMGQVMGQGGEAPDPAKAVERAKQGAAQMVDKAGEIKPEATRAAWITFGALMVSLLAAVLGAMAGRRRPDQMVARA